MAEQQANGRFDIVRVYLKDASFESPQVPRVFAESGLSPSIDVQLQSRHEVLNRDSGHYEVELAVTATARDGDRTVFLVEVKQGGIFQIQGFDSTQVPVALEVACPEILLPFAREVVNNLVTHGGFPPLLINPVNFEALRRDKERGGSGEQAGSRGAGAGSAPGGTPRLFPEE